jgi:PAS domain S-box-containing protein
VRISDLAREALRLSESRYRRLFETAQDGILLLNADTAQIEDVNPYLIDMLGYSHEEFLGKKLWEVGPFADIAQSKEMFAELQAVGYARYEDLPLKTKAGARVAVEFVSNSYDCEGIKVIQCNIRNITDRKEAERRLVDSEGRFRAVIEQSIAAIYVIQDGKIVYVNPRMREIFGYAVDEVFDPNPLAHINESEWPRVAEQMQRRMDGEGEAAYALTARRKDGSEFSFGIHATRAVYRNFPAIVAVGQDISERVRAVEDTQRFVERLKTALHRTIEVVSTIGEIRDPYTHGHERRVGEFAAAIGAEMGLDDDRIEGLRVAGHMHDVGKISAPAEILSKPGKLSPPEFKLIMNHAQQGYEILKGVEFPWPVAQVALQHHERLDGSGYPQGLKGDAIILEARIMAIADVVEAMSSYRPYRPSLGIDKALEEIERGRGTIYDTAAADACLRLFREKGYTIPD